jgi:hypothetical protein
MVSVNTAGDERAEAAKQQHQQDPAEHEGADGREHGCRRS